jgi:hypothetical protein
MPQGVLLIQQLLDMHANFNGGSMHNGVGIFNDENVKSLISSRYVKMLVFARK